MFPVLLIKKPERSETLNLHFSIINFQLSPGSFSKNLMIPEVVMISKS
jgi:hypothetical protein